MKTIQLQDIDRQDRSFCISYPLEDEKLCLSIARTGICQPLILLASGKTRIISGYKRLWSAMRLGLEAVPCVILDVSDREALLRAIHSNLSKNLNIVEKATALQRMEALGFEEEELYGMLVMMDLQPHARILAMLLSLARVDDEAKTFVVSRCLSLKSAGLFLRFERQERERIIHLLAPVHTTESYIREILELLSILKVRHGAIDFDALGGSGKAEGLRKRLKMQTHPLLSARERDLEQLTRQCALPPGMDIRVDPFFEKEYIDIRIKVKKEQDVEQGLDKIRLLLQTGYIGRILELTKG
jgi:ParB-like chromosome segregation protein Spo0J